MRGARLLLVCLLPVIARAEQPLQSAPCTVDDLAWLQGSWQTESVAGRPVFAERWWRDGAALRGEAGRVGAAAGVRETVGVNEEMLLVAMRGGMHYLALPPQNRVPVAFTATACSAGEAVFENPGHDFPQRLHYRIADDGTLQVRVQAGERGFALQYSRQSAE